MQHLISETCLSIYVMFILWAAGRELLHMQGLMFSEGTLQLFTNAQLTDLAGNSSLGNMSMLRSLKTTRTQSQRCFLSDMYTTFTSSLIGPGLVQRSILQCCLQWYCTCRSPLNQKRRKRMTCWVWLRAWKSIEVSESKSNWVLQRKCRAKYRTARGAET